MNREIAIVVTILALSDIMGVASRSMLRARIELLETQKEEVVIENIFLARKLGEAVHETRGRFAKMECQTDLNAAGFRMGHNSAYRMMRAGVFESCNTLEEVYVD